MSTPVNLSNSLRNLPVRAVTSSISSPISDNSLIASSSPVVALKRNEPTLAVFPKYLGSL